MITSQTELTNNPHLLVLLQGGGPTLSVRWPISPVDGTNPSWDRNGLQSIYYFARLPVGSPLGVKCHNHILCQISNTHTGINHCVIFLQDPRFLFLALHAAWAVSQPRVRSSCLWASALRTVSNPSCRPILPPNHGED